MRLRAGLKHQARLLFFGVWVIFDACLASKARNFRDVGRSDCPHSINERLPTIVLPCCKATDGKQQIKWGNTKTVAEKSSNNSSTCDLGYRLNITDASLTVSLPKENKDSIRMYWCWVTDEAGGSDNVTVNLSTTAIDVISVTESAPNVTLHCPSSSGNSEQTSWYKISESDHQINQARHQQIHTGPELVISPVELSSSGQYYCKVVSYHGGNCGISLHRTSLNVGPSPESQIGKESDRMTHPAVWVGVGIGIVMVAVIVAVLVKKRIRRRQNLSNTQGDEGEESADNSQERMLHQNDLENRV